MASIQGVAGALLGCPGSLHGEVERARGAFRSMRSRGSSDASDVGRGGAQSPFLDDGLLAGGSAGAQAVRGALPPSLPPQPPPLRAAASLRCDPDVVSLAPACFSPMTRPRPFPCVSN